MDICPAGGQTASARQETSRPHQAEAEGDPLWCGRGACLLPVKGPLFHAALAHHLTQNRHTPSSTEREGGPPCTRSAPGLAPRWCACRWWGCSPRPPGIPSPRPGLFLRNGVSKSAVASPHPFWNMGVLGAGTKPSRHTIERWARTSAPEIPVPASLGRKFH